MVTAARACAAVLLTAVFLGHGLQCGSGSGGAAHGDHGGSSAEVAASTATDTHLAPSHHGLAGVATTAPAAVHDVAPTVTAGSAPGHWHGLPDHLWAVCLAVLAAGLAVLFVLACPRLLGQALPTALPSWLRGLSWPAPLRPPDPFSLCVLRT